MPRTCELRGSIRIVTIAIVTTAAGLLWGVTPIARGALVHYTLTDLGSVANFGSAAWGGINNAGKVVGSSNVTANSDEHAFLYDQYMQDLGVPPTGGWSSTIGFDINDSGVIAGAAYKRAGAIHAVQWAAGQWSDLGTLGGSDSVAYGINASGQIVGYAATSTGAERTFLYSSGHMTDIGSIPGYSWSYASGINNTGQVAGYGGVDNTSSSHAFLYSNGQMTDLGTLGGPDSMGNGINNLGQVVGSADSATKIRAFLYFGGQMHDLGALSGGDSLGNGVNDFGDVVGSSRVVGDPFGHAFLYTGNGPMVDLNPLIDNPGGLKMTEATGINNNGQICGMLSNGHAGLLTPVPEPAAAAMILLSASGVVVSRSRRRPRLSHRCT